METLNGQVEALTRDLLKANKVVVIRSQIFLNLSYIFRICLAVPMISYFLITSYFVGS